MTRRILVVDDDDAVRGLVQTVLEMEGFDVVAAPDGFAALAAVEQHHPDCVVLDVMMPGIDGHEVLRRLRAAPPTRGLPVVMLTAYADDMTAWQAWRAGVDYFLAKPFEPEELLRWLDYLFTPDGQPVDAA